MYLQRIRQHRYKRPRQCSMVSVANSILMPYKLLAVTYAKESCRAAN